MNATTKNIGLFAILSLATVALSTSFIGEADAASRSAVEAFKEKGQPQADPVSSEPKPTGTVPEPKGKQAPAPLGVNPGVDLTIEEVFQRGDTYPDTQSFKGFNQEQYDTTQTFQVSYLVQNAGDTEVQNVELMVWSDIETIQERLQGNLDPKHSVITVMIQAEDPDSINAKITGYELSN